VRTTQLGQLEVSVIGLGCNNFGRNLDLEQSKQIVHAALEAGITYFDTARTYGEGRSESFLAAGLGRHRDEVVIATKFGRIPRLRDIAGAGREDVRRTVEESLAALGTDYIDLYQLHFPDPDVPITETLGVLSELVAEGKVREIGCANFGASQLEEALDASDANGWPRFVSNQVHYSLIHRHPEEDGLVDLCLTRDVTLLPYYPLGSGLLTGKVRRGEQPTGRLAGERYKRFLTDENFDIAERVEAFAASRQLTPSQVALAWLLNRPGVRTVTPGATRPEHVVVNASAADWEPTPDDIEALDRLAAEG
jgi:aryl-alcohol dehydrogenase-like predicted oxidoreductase